MKRHLAAVSLALTLVVSLATPAMGGDVVLDEVATGLSSPVYVDAPEGDDRLFIVEQGGTIRILEDGAVLPTPFLDIRSRVLHSGERGLLGLAFHPNYSSNGLFYVHYTDTGGDTQVAEYEVSANPDRADHSTFRSVYTLDQPSSNHNGGWIGFGPDGYLYIALGDGGGSNDTYGNGQNTSTEHGSILRISASSGAGAAGNPHGRIWAWGIRNAWRASFDTATNGLYVGDVGQSAREEVSVVNAAGANLGWPILEGSICRPPTSGCTAPAGYVGPIAEYSIPGGPRSITGGYVYRGSELPKIEGTYFYGDFFDGEIRSFVDVGGVATQERNWSVDLGVVPRLVSFGTDGDEELHAVSLQGSVFRFVEGATRLWGSDRYATAAAVSAHAFPTADVAYIVTGENWPDALIAASRGDGPVLLVRKDSTPSATKKALQALGTLDHIYVVGGTAAVSAGVASEIGPYASNVTRLSGSNRYGTATAFSQEFHSSASTVYVATGENFPDALVTAAAAGAADAPILLVTSSAVPSATISELKRLAPDEIVIVGGTSVIGSGVENTLDGLASTVRRIAGSNRYDTAARVADDTFSSAPLAYVASGESAPDALVAAAAAIAGGGPVLLVRSDSLPTQTATSLIGLAPADILLSGGPAAVDRQVQADLGLFLP